MALAVLPGLWNLGFAVQIVTQTNKQTYLLNTIVTPAMCIVLGCCMVKTPPQQRKWNCSSSLVQGLTATMSQGPESQGVREAENLKKNCQEM